MAKNMKKHTCNDTCKGRAVNTMSCFLCGELFFAKWFSLDAATHVKVNSIESYIRFVCGICQSSFNSNKRKSLGTPMAHSQSTTAASDDINSNNNIINDNIKKILDLLLSMRTPDNISMTNASSSDSNANDNNNKGLEAENLLTIKNMYKIVMKIDDKVDKLHSSSNEKTVFKLLQV